MHVAKRCLLHFIDLKIPQFPLVNSQSNTKEKLLQLYQSLPEKVITDLFFIKCYKGDLQNTPIKFYFKMMNQSYIGPLFVKSAIILKWIQQSFDLIASNSTLLRVSKKIQFAPEMSRPFTVHGHGCRKLHSYIYTVNQTF